MAEEVRDAAHRASMRTLREGILGPDPITGAPRVRRLPTPAVSAPARKTGRPVRPAQPEPGRAPSPAPRDPVPEPATPPRTLSAVPTPRTSGSDLGAPAAPGGHPSIVVIDATGLPDGYPGPLWWSADAPDCAALVEQFHHAVPWPRLGIWTDYVPPGRGVPIPASVRRVPILPVRKAGERWSTLWGRTAKDPNTNEQLFWLLALDFDGTPVGLWPTIPTRAAQLLAAVAGADVALPDAEGWPLDASAVNAARHTVVPAPAREELVEQPGDDPGDDPGDLLDEW